MSMCGGGVVVEACREFCDSRWVVVGDLTSGLEGCKREDGVGHAGRFVGRG